MATIIPFLQDNAFDPDALRAMSTALEEVCRKLQVNGDRRVREAMLAICMGVAPTSGHSQWMEAKIPGEQHRAVQGCAAEVRKPGDWVCILVRCDEPRTSPSLHFSASGPGIRGNIKLVIDDATFTLSVPTSSKSTLALSTRAETVPDNLLEAMKAGKALSIEGTDLTPPYNRISLENSRKAIEPIEQICARSRPSAASILRRLARGVRL
jgi:hypothetical protein